jgi:hypothetical protein
MSDSTTTSEAVPAQSLDDRLKVLDPAELELLSGRDRFDGAFDNEFDNSFDNSGT